MKTTEYGAPDHLGRRRVWFYINDFWVAKGWLMPEIGR